MKRPLFALAALLCSLTASAAPPSTFVGLSLSIPFNDTPSLAVKPSVRSLSMSAYTTNAAAPTEAPTAAAPIASTVSTTSPTKSAAAIPMQGGHGGGHLGGNGNGHGGHRGTAVNPRRN